MALSTTTLAAAAPTALSPLDLPTAGNFAMGYDVAFTSDGTTVVVWATEDPDTLSVSFRERGGATFVDHVPLVADDEVEDPQVHVADDGTITVSWHQYNDETVAVGRRAPGEASFSPPEIVAQGRVFEHQLLGAPDGSLRVLSLHEGVFPDEVRFMIRETTLPADGDDWVASQLVTSAGELSPFSDLKAQIDDTGAWTATWVVNAPKYNGLLPPEVYAVSASAEGDLSEPKPLNVDGTVALAPDVAVSAAGATGTPTPLGAAADDIRGPLVAVDAHGTEMVTWGAHDPDAHYLVVHTRSAGGQTSDEVVAEGQGDATPTDLTVAADGSVTVAWDTGTTPDVTSWVAHRTASRGSSFSEPLRLDSAGSGNSQDASLGVDDEGTVAAVWTHRHGPDHVGPKVSIRSGVVDVTGPVLSAVEIPHSSNQGAATTMAAQAHDSWSEPTTITWDFGDGAIASGATVSHAYDAPGAFLVTVTAQDNVGNVTAARHLSAVSASGSPVVPPQPNGDRTAPVLSRSKVRPQALTRAAKVRLSTVTTESATLKAVVQRRRDGTGWRRAKAISWRAAAGRTTRILFGKTSAASLKPGAYRVRLTASDAAGNRSQPVTVRWRVARR